MINLTKEYLEGAYARLGTLNAIGDEVGLERHAISRHMKKYNIARPREKYDFDTRFFSRDNEQSFYWAGFFAADGCVMDRNDGGYQIYLGLCTKDKYHIAKLKEIIGVNKNIYDRIRTYVDRKDTYFSELCFYCKPMFDDLARFNVVPRKTYTYKMPDWLVSHDLVHHFMRGYFDGDGSYYIKNNKSIWNDKHVCMRMRGCYKFLDQFDHILFDGGIIKRKDFRRRPMDGSPQDTKPMFDVLMYQGNGIVLDITNFLYHDATIFLERKYDVVQHIHEFTAEKLRKRQEKKDRKKQQVFEIARISHTQVEMAEKMNCTPANISYLLAQYKIEKEIQDILNNNVKHNISE